MSILRNLFHYKDVRKLMEYCKTKEISAFEIQRVYSSTLGMKKEYPSYLSRLSIYISSDTIIFLSYKRFPFIFRTWDIPFILTVNPDFVKHQIPVLRIFRPTSISATEQTLTFNFVDNVTFKTEVNIQLELPQNIQRNFFDKINTFKTNLDEQVRKTSL